MQLKTFLKLVEIQTKAASVLPFLLGIAFTYYRYQAFNAINLGIFLLSLISIDMATTAINNYMDYKRAKKQRGYNYEEHNAIVRDNLKDRQVLAVIGILLSITVIAGLVLVVRTDLIILAVGMVAFGIGVLYSFGPLPISRTPLGEVFSGIMMGGFIFFVTVYCQTYDMGYIRFSFSFTDWIFQLHVNILELVVIAFACAPLMLLIANIMLTNNICDLEDDIENHRYTLPFFIGRKLSLILFVLIHIGAYSFIFLSILLNFLPIVTALTFITLIPVSQGIRTFLKEQKKETTFVISVKHFVLFSGVYLLSLIIHIIAAKIIS